MDEGELFGLGDGLGDGVDGMDDVNMNVEDIFGNDWDSKFTIKPYLKCIWFNLVIEF